jgi:phosphoenolpyruvate carboxylase
VLAADTELIVWVRIRMAKPSALRNDVETLNRLLDQTLLEQVGAELANQLRQLRQLAQERRAGLPGAGERLAAHIATLDETEISQTVRAFSIYFDLSNLAEDLHRVRVLRERELHSRGETRPESLADAIRRFSQNGVSAMDVQRQLDRLCIDLVFTAHPTEAKRRTTRRVLRRMRQRLRMAHTPDTLDREQQALFDGLLSDLALLWQTDPIRPQRPTVMHEVERGLFFFDGLWETLPILRQQLRQALSTYYPDHTFRIPAFIRFGSWIGGDRDGNPFVTHDVTAQALELLRKTALERHLGVCQALSHLLVMSERQVPVEPALQQALQHALSQSTAARDACSSVSEVELYRRWLKFVEVRLKATLAAAGGAPSEGLAYKHRDELAADVQLLHSSVVKHAGQRIASTLLQPWLDQIETFGLQFASLDVRQDSRVHVDVLAEVFQKTGLCADYAAADETTRQSLLTAPCTVGNELMTQSLSDQARETLSLFKLLVRVVKGHGVDRLGGHVISMTHYPSDVLAVLWLWRWAWRASPGDQTQQPVYLPIVPLFETIDDLKHGPEILLQLLSIPAYAEYLRSGAVSTPAASGNTADANPTQIIMVGYSDSTKDGGYLAACWGLFCVQDRLAAVTAEHGVRLIVFHGRGGALGRGGGPAARAILSLPAHSVGGALRMTEQGEVLAERYDDPQIAQRHLEQVTWATLLVSGLPAEPTPASWSATLEQLSSTSFHAYRELVEHPAFLKYFDQATPISEIERLPIGSRPSRRRERKSLSDLRAIPWTFAWTQSRHFLPAWYGLGAAILKHVSERNDDWTELQSMYDRWPLFQAVVDNAMLALAKADMGIAQRYADLGDPETKPVWELIKAEFERSQAAVLLITRESMLLAGTPWLQQSILERNPTVDPLNLMQIELLQRIRRSVEAGTEETTNRLIELTRLAIQGIAAGLRTTG